MREAMVQAQGEMALSGEREWEGSGVVGSRKGDFMAEVVELMEVEREGLCQREEYDGGGLPF